MHSQAGMRMERIVSGDDERGSRVAEIGGMAASGVRVAPNAAASRLSGWRGA